MFALLDRLGTILCTRGVRQVPRRLRFGALLGTFTALVLLLAWWLASQWYQTRLLHEERARLAVEVSLHENALSLAVNRRIALLQELYAFVNAELLEEDLASHFEPFATQLHANTQGIRILAVAPGSVIRYIYPVNGNQDALGYNALGDAAAPDIGDDARRAIETRQIVVTKPRKLFHGDTGLFAQRAVYRRNGSYWGLVCTVIDLSSMFDEADLHSLQSGAGFALRDESGYVFFGAADVFKQEPVLAEVQVLEHKWVLAAIPDGGWSSTVHSDLLVFQVTGLLVVGLSCILVFLSISRQQRLSFAVEQRTQEITRINKDLERDIAQRKRAEEALRQAETKYRSIFENSVVGHYQSALDGRILSANPALAHIFGHDSPAQIIAAFINVGQRLYVEPNRRAEFQRRLERDTVLEKFESQAYRKDGGVIWISENARVIHDSHGKPLYYEGVTEDITDRKRSEAALRDSEERFQLIAEVTSDAIWDWNLVTHDVHWNQGIRTVFGYPSEMTRDHSWWQMHVHPEDVDFAEASLRSAIARGERFWTGEYRFRRADGSYATVRDRGYVIRDASSQALRMIGALVDITEQAQAQLMLEQRVEERTRQLSTLLDVAQSVASTLALSELLDLVLQQLKMVVDYSGATIFALQDDEFRVLDYQGPLPREQVRSTRYPVKPGLPLWLTIHQRAPVILPDLWSDVPLSQAMRAAYGAQLKEIYGDIHSWMAVPLMVKDRLVGVLALDYPEADYYTAQDAQLLLAFANHVAVAIENARLFEEARGIAALEERHRLARELHDSVTQMLYSLTLFAEAGRQQLSFGDRDRVEHHLHRIGETAQQALKEMRLMVYELRPPVLQEVGLVGALRQRLDAVEQRAGLDAQLVVGDFIDISAQAEEGLYRIAQEALNNALKHAEATSVTVHVCTEGQLTILEVSDNGKGCDLAAAEKTGGLGLISMRERAAKLGGTLTIASVLGQGTWVKVQVYRATGPEQTR